MSESPSWIKSALRRTSVKAEDYINDPTKVQRLLHDVQKKTQTLNLDGTPFGALANQGGVLWRMLRSWQKGEYRVAPKGVIISAIAALLYFLMPFDVIPDFIAGLGLADDAVLVAFVLRSIRGDIDKFNTWELVQKGRKATIVDGKVAYVAPAEEIKITVPDRIVIEDVEPEPAEESTQIPVENLNGSEPSKRPWWSLRQGKK